MVGGILAAGYMISDFIFKQDKFDEFKSPTKGYLRETCKSQNLIPFI